MPAPAPFALRRRTEVVREDDGAHGRLAGSGLAHQQDLQAQQERAREERRDAQQQMSRIRKESKTAFAAKEAVAAKGAWRDFGIAGAFSAAAMFPYFVAVA